MPAKSEKQLNLMRAVVAGKSKKVPKSVAKEYIKNTPKGKFSNKKS